MNDFLKSLLAVAMSAAPWSAPATDSDGETWTKNSWLNIPANRRMYSLEDDVNDTCSRIFGAYSGGGKYGGCVSYGYDQDGLLANVFLPKDRTIRRAVQDHEERHATGEVHPWLGFAKGLPPQ